MSNFKCFKGGKSKAVKGLKRVDARLEQYAGKLVIKDEVTGEFGFDTVEVQALLTLWAEQDAAEATVAPRESVSEGGAALEVEVNFTEEEEEEDPALPRENGNMFGSMALALSNVGATVTPPAAQASRVANRGAYKIEKERPVQNGIKRPSAGGLCRAVWDEMDHLKETLGTVPTTAHVAAAAEKNSWNKNNALIEYYQWRKFNGITGRAKKVVAAEPLVKEEA